ncbi:T9SS type A sorting domain-containing protein [Polaribacter porphyrae]|nr:T9SS type A sorting domain-containing protein [Polaribacter porphyrae]
MKNRFKNLVVIVILLKVSITFSQYSETFSIENKGILPGGVCSGSALSSCSSVDFSGVNWTLGGDLSGIDTEGFYTSSGALTAFDIDNEACWISPEINISAPSQVSFSLDLAWGAIDATEYINVSYSIDGGAFVQVSNVVGGGTRTIEYPSGTSGDNTTININSLTGNTLTIMVCADFNLSSEFFTLDNVSVPEAGVFVPVFNTWNGNTSTNWTTASNWSAGSVPVSSDNVIIPNVTNKPVINASTSAETNSLTIEASSLLTINGGGNLIVNGDFTNNGQSLVANSSSSFIVKGTATGQITYSRNLPTNNWYLVGSPLSGETLADLILNHTFALGTSTNIGLAPYVNDGTGWNYLTSASVGNIISGTGYSVKLTSPGDISFTGTLQDTDVGVAINTNTNGFNLVSNPYPSYIAANNTANATNNLLKLNDTDNDFLTESTLWFWNQSSNSYDQVNHATGAFHIAPGQGFFVSANGSNTLSFTEAMQSHQSSDTFQKTVTNNRPEIKLMLSDGNTTKKTDIFYIAGTSTAFDNGYDSSIFGGITNNFNIFTETVSNGSGRKLGIQSLPIDNYENMIIPIGITASIGTDITISAASINLPEQVKIYLEDRVNNTFTALDKDTSFSTKLDIGLNGIGRFYLHTTSTTLSTNQLVVSGINVYATSKNYLKVTGFTNNLTEIKMYSILGKEVFKRSFKGNGSNSIEIPSLKQGIYIIELQNEQTKFNKKIVLK